jgi:NAD(P)H-quinone oxidoreductase subunit I
MGRLPYKVTQDPMVTPLRELAYLPKGVLDPHGLPAGSERAGLRPEQIVEQMEPKAEEAAKK